MTQMIDFNQIRINAVLGVCARQRELVKENRRLAKQARFNDEMCGAFGFAAAVLLTMFCIIL